MKIINAIKDKIKVLVLIFIFTFILVVFIDFLLNPAPPKVLFVDENREDPLSGKVYLDGQYMGDSTENGFTDLPEEFCEGSHDISLETGENTYSWPTDEEDCDLNSVVFVVEKASQTRDEDIVFRFFVRETEEPLSGNLYFNNQLVSNIEGEYTVERERCKEVLRINLTSSTYNIEWIPHSRWCNLYDTIDLSVPKEDIQRSELSSVVDVIANSSQS